MDRQAKEHLIISDIQLSDNKFIYRFVCNYFKINEFKLQIGIKKIINFSSYLIDSDKSYQLLYYFKNFKSDAEMEKFISLYYFLAKGY